MGIDNRNVASMVTHLFFSRAIFQETCPVLNVHVSCKNLKKKKTSKKIQIKIQQSLFLMETETSTESLLLLVHIVAKSVS